MMGMKITPQSVVVASRDQLSSNLDGDTVIVGLRRGNYYGLSSVGVRVWQLIQTPTAVADLGRMIAAEYDVSPKRCEADVLELLECMVEEGLIEVESALIP